MKDLFNEIVRNHFMFQEECFEKYKNEKGTCYGVVGGTSNTNYLSEYCIGCKYFEMYKV